MWRLSWSKEMHHGLTVMGFLMLGPPWELQHVHARVGQWSERGSERREGGWIERDKRRGRRTHKEGYRWRWTSETVRKTTGFSAANWWEIDVFIKQKYYYSQVYSLVSLIMWLLSEEANMFQLDNHLSFYEYTELIFSPCCSAVGLHLSAWLNWQVALLSRNADVDDTVHCVCAQAYVCVPVCVWCQIVYIQSNVSPFIRMMICAGICADTLFTGM